MGLWSAIKHAINSTIGTEDFIPIDKMITNAIGGYVIFKEPGVYEFKPKKGIEEYYITACGGGGGAGGNSEVRGYS